MQYTVWQSLLLTYLVLADVVASLQQSDAGVNGQDAHIGVGRGGHVQLNHVAWLRLGLVKANRHLWGRGQFIKSP